MDSTTEGISGDEEMREGLNLGRSGMSESHFVRDVDDVLVLEKATSVKGEERMGRWSE